MNKKTCDHCGEQFYTRDRRSKELTLCPECKKWFDDCDATFREMLEEEYGILPLEQ